MLDIGLKDIIDILLVALTLYYSYRLMRHTRAVNIFYGVLLFVIFWIVVSKILGMRLIGGILDQLVSVGAIAFIVLFQEEIRRFFYHLGTSNQRHFLARWLRQRQMRALGPGFRRTHADVIPIVMACLNMSKQKVGALIVMKNDQPLADVTRTGEELIAKISQRLIENIFFKNSPLHDGAMVISDNQITAAACILPVSHDLDIPKDFGLRHRAARGISTETDALAVVVSEETGNITVAWGGQFQSHISPEELEVMLMKGRF